LVRSGATDDYTVALTTPLGRTTTYRVEELPNGSRRLTATDAAGARSQSVQALDGGITTTLRDGSTVSVLLAPDPRWGMRAPVAATLTSTTPSGSKTVTTMQRSVQLVNSADPLSLAALSEHDHD
jgi:hypothetical protein